MEADEVRDDLRDYVAAHLGDPRAVLVVDRRLALDAKLPAAWVTGDEIYGADPGLRARLESSQKDMS